MAKEFYVQLVYHYTESKTSSVSASISSGKKVDGQLVTTNKYLLPNVPTDSEIIVEIQRPNGEIPLRTCLKLGKVGKSRFIWGKPRMMNFVGVEAKSPSRITLQVDLYTPQEVILCSGRDGKDGKSPMMANLGNRRMQGLTSGTTNLKAGHLCVNDSCVFTFFEFLGKKSRIHHLLRGSGPANNLPGNGALGAGVKMGDYPLPAGVDHLRIMDVYDYLAECGRSRPNTIVALEFMSHGYLGGPVLEDTWRIPPENSPNYWDQLKTVCNEQCPIDISHGVDVFPTPDYFRMLEYHISTEERRAYLATNGIAWVSVRQFAPGYPQPGRPDTPRIEHRSRATFEVLSEYENTLPEDADPRATDFLFMTASYLNDMRNSMHTDCIIRTWGCMWGDEGPRLQQYSLHHYQGSNARGNERLDIRSDYPLVHEGFSIAQRWLIRRKDGWLHFLSLLRRTYAQAIATYLQRPCYAALPGNWAEVTPSPQLLGMRIPPDLRADIRNLAKGVLDSEYDLDEAGYVRYIPTPARKHVVITVLVTGFRPFMGNTANASQESVRLLRQAEILSSIHIPSWIDLELRLQTISDVDVVWSCDASVDPSPGTPTRVRGGAGIVDFIHNMPDGGPDIVLAVGETQRVIVNPNDPPLEPPGPEWFRLEAYAHNAGGTKWNDNEGNALVSAAPAGAAKPTTTPIFRGKPDYLETSIPRLSYLQATERLYHHPALRPQGYLPRVEKFDFPAADGDNPRSLRLPPIPPSSDPNRQQRIAAENAQRLVTPVGSAGDFICNETYYHLLLESQMGYEAKTRVNGRSTTTARYPASGRWVLFSHVYNHRHPIAYSAIATALSVTVASLCEDMLWATTMHGRHAPVRVSVADSDRLTVLDGKNGIPTS